MKGGLPILMFHVLDDGRAPVCFPVDAFERAVARFHATGHRTLRFCEAARRLVARESLPERAVVLTFDDGDASVFRHAWPVLRRYDMTATVFLLPPATKGTRRYLGRPLVGAGEARELHAAGIEIGAHTLDHPDLTRLGPAALEDQVRGSRAVLEDLLGAAVPSFAYPFGRHDEPVRAAVRRHFDWACTDELGLARPGDDPRALARVDAYYLRGCFGLFSGTWLPWYLRLRNLPRRARRALLARLPDGSTDCPP